MKVKILLICSLIDENLYIFAGFLILMAGLVHIFTWIIIQYLISVAAADGWILPGKLGVWTDAAAEE